MMLMYSTAQMHPVPDIRSPGPWRTKQLAHGARDKGMTKDYKVILTSRLPSAKLIYSMTTTKFRKSTLLLMSLLDTYMWI